MLKARQRFNLGISYITLQRYEGAAVHIMDALALQEHDGMGNNGGVTSSVLWNSLRNVCNHLGRNDLALFCDTRNLNSTFEHPSIDSRKPDAFHRVSCRIPPSGLHLVGVLS